MTKFHQLKKDVRADRRRLAFKMLDNGQVKQDIAALLEVNLSVIYDWIKNRQELEKNNYHGLKRGNPDDQKLLSKIQQEQVLKAIKKTIPKDHEIEYFLWSAKAVREYIKKTFNLDLSQQRISDHTISWGLSSQRPTKQAAEQDPEKIKQWLEVDYPKIKKQAKKEGAEIHWADETNLNINTNYQKSYSPKGQTPVAIIPARKTSYSMISSLTNQGKLRYMAYKGGMNAKLFLVFLKRLVKDVNQKNKKGNKKIFLIVDNLRVHHAKVIQKWQKENSDKISFFSLPPYAPQYNPDEFLNNDITQNINKRNFPKNDQELKRNIHKFMRSTQRKPEKVRNYFKVKYVEYAG